MDWGMKCSGLVPQTVAVNAMNESCKIILLFWNFGSGVYALLSGSSYITAGCCGVPICPNLANVVFSIGVACTGLCIVECVLNFLFSFGAVLTLFLARYPLGIHTNLVGVIFLVQVGLAVWSPLSLAE